MGKSRAKRIGKLLLLFTIFHLLGLALFSEIIVTADTDRDIINSGESFSFILTIEAKNEKLKTNPTDVKFPKIDGLKILNTYTSSTHSYSFINGKMSSSDILKIFFQLAYLGNKKKIKIPGIKVIVNNKSYFSNPVEISVGGGNRGINNKLEKDYFISTDISKQKVYEFEPFTLSFSLYVKANLRISNINLTGKENPNNFFIHSLYDIFKQRPQDIISSIKIINGKKYRKILLFKYEIAASKSGVLKLPVFTLEGIISKPDNFFEDDFFGFGKSFVPQRVILFPGKKTVKVKPLPPIKKENFSGIVSNSLKIKSSISKREVKAGEGITYTLTLQGKIFKDLVKAPAFKKSNLFEFYEPEVEELPTGISFKYLIIPKVSGELEIPEVSLTYFDITKEKYITLKTKKIKIKVLKSDNYIYISSEKRELIKIKTGDIYFLKPVNTINGKFRPVYKQLWFWTIFLLSIIMLLIKIVILIRKRKVERNQRLKRNILASKRARKWKKKAKKIEEKEFFAFAYNFLFDYLINKLNIENTAITVEKLTEIIKKEKGDEISSRVKNIFSHIEMAKFSPEKRANIKEIIDEIGKLIDIMEKG